MWRRTALIVAILLALATRGKLNGQERTCPDLLLTDLSWVRFDVIMGRIVAATNRTKQDRQCAHREGSDGATETLVVSIDRGLTSLQYTLKSATQQLAIRVVRRDDVFVRSETLQPDGMRTTMTYSQSPGKEVRLAIIENAGAEKNYQAPSLWHLLIIKPELGKTPIFDILESLRPDWHLRSEAKAIGDALVATGPWEVTTSLEEVKALVRQLAHRDFHVRQAADRELRSRGRAVLCLFNELDPRQLDCEQRLRIREIRRQLTGDSNDTPQRVAHWLVNDKRVWLALKDQGVPRSRLVAREHLARIVK